MWLVIRLSVEREYQTTSAGLLKPQRNGREAEGEDSVAGVHCFGTLIYNNRRKIQVKFSLIFRAAPSA
jgi:hypothetical protein